MLPPDSRRYIVAISIFCKLSILRYSAPALGELCFHIGVKLTELDSWSQKVY